MRKKYLLYITLFFISFVLTSCSGEGYLSYTLKIKDRENNKYTINTTEYGEGIIFCRRDDWTDEDKGSLSYIIKKDEEQNISYFIIHEEKKAFLINEDKISWPEEEWIGEMKERNFKKEIVGEEEIESFLCEKIKYTDESSNEECTLWFSPELGRPLKIISAISDCKFKMEISEINREIKEENCFTIPKDYKIITFNEEEWEPFSIY